MGHHAEDDEASGLTPAWIPTLQEVVEANRLIHEAYGTPEWHKLYSRGFVEFQLERAEEACSGATVMKFMMVAAELAHGLARAQAFRDGNHRTAHVICQTFLNNNALGHLSPLRSDDDELVDHLLGTGIKYEPADFGPEDTAELFRRRQCRGRKPGY